MVHMRKFLILALSFVGLFDSLYLLWAYTSPSHPLVCLGTGCDVARASSYAHLWGLPLPLFGVAMYGALALLAVAEAIGGSVLYPVVRYAVLVISGAGFVASLALSGIEAFVLHAWCAWCVLSAIVVTLILILAVYGVARPRPPLDSASALRAVRMQFILLIIAIIAGSAAFAHLLNSGEMAPAKPVSEATLNERLVRPDSHATGNLNSPVTVVEFGDFECPMCGLAQKTVEQMLKDYGDKVRFVFRQYPLVDAHHQAEKAAEASECAAEQGKFWQAEDLLYQKQSDLSVDALKSYAQQLGLDTGKFDECLSSGKMKDRVQQDIADGKAVGVAGTPTFFVGHEKIVGPPKYAELSELLDRQLASHGTLSAGAAAPGNPGNSAQPSGSPQSNGLGAGAALGGGSVFSQMQAQSSLACNPNEAQQQQPTLIRTPEAKKLFEGNPKPLFVDVRSAQEFAAGHIPGAMNLPVEDVPQQWNKLPQNQVIVFYEGGERSGSPDDVCAFSRAAARVVLSHGFDKAKVKVYQDGLKDWEKAGLPVQR